MPAEVNLLCSNTYGINIDEMSTEFHTVLLFMKEVKEKKSAKMRTLKIGQFLDEILMWHQSQH